ncbi:hypothetical protein D3C83_49530 [compost metagenome]
MLGLHLGEVEDGHQAFLRHPCVVAAAHDLDDLVDVDDRDQEPFDEVQLVGRLAEPEPGTSSGHLVAVLEIDL